MNDPIPDFFIGDDPNKHFYRVISLHEATDLDWDQIAQTLPLLPRGWFELASLPLEDRIEFTHQYWLSKLPFVDTKNQYLECRLNDFFKKIDEIGIYATQIKQEGSFEIHMVYSLKEEGGFFQGFPPASDETLKILQKRFGDIHFPSDYLAFLQIHDGFSKYTDTGMIKSRDMAPIYQKLQHLLAEEILVQPNGEMIDPEHLIPFYESFDLYNYQCFYTDWHPNFEMGNVCFSEHDRSISNFVGYHNHEASLAFPSFLEWLMFYLEDMWHP